MRFATCALALLLVAGTQTDSIQAQAQAQAPMPLEGYRVAAMAFLGTMKDGILTAISNYGFDTMAISKPLDLIQEHIQVAYAVVSPYFNDFINSAIEATSGLHETLLDDVEALYNSLRPGGEELRQVLGKHLHEYRETLDPVMQEFSPMYNLGMQNFNSKLQAFRAKMAPVVVELGAKVQAFRAKMAPVVEELGAKAQANVEETKSKLVPIIEAVRAKLTERLEEMKTIPYVEKNRKMLLKAIGRLSEKMANYDILAKRLKPELSKVMVIIVDYFGDLGNYDD